MFSIFKRSYTIDDLNEFNRYYTINRSKFSIAIIDDEEFPYLKVIRDHGYQATKFDDITSTKQLVEYDIIICDVRDVGKSFGSKYEGGHLIQEISKNLPHKYLIAYSGSVFNPEYNKFFSLCDESVMKKGIDINDIINMLDRAIKSITNPTYQWKKTRAILEESGISSKEIANIESKYIKALVSRKTRILERKINKISASPIGKNDNIKLILNSLALFTGSLISNLSK